MSRIQYVRLDGTTFTHYLFHPRMEHASVVDPRDGRLRTFKTEFDKHGTPLRRVEVEPGEPA